MKKPWKSTSSAGGSARPRTGPHTIRGRISGPVPIPSPMDDEFPLRNPGPNISTPLRAEFKESQTESIFSGRDQQTPAPPAPPIASTPTLQPSHLAHDDVRATQPVVSPVNSLVPEMRAPPTQRTNPSNPIRHSTVSADAIQIKDRDRPHRKQSKLRGAIGKLLGRRRKQHPYDSPNHTDSEVVSTPIGEPEDYHEPSAKPTLEDDPRPLNRPDPRTRSRPFPGAESKRSASLPITEFDRALRSHSVRPEDVRAIESARNSLSAEFGLSRRQTGPMRSKEDDLTGLSPRPASSQGRDSRTAQHEDDPGEIGRAITSDYMGSRRRSRSLSGLPEVEEDNGKTRRRSDEIRYWRESYDPAFMSPVSSNAQDGEDGAAVDNETNQNTEEDAPRTLPEPFQFDSFATMKEIGRMKITHAADLETRVCNLESRVQRLEQVLDHVCTIVPDLQSHLGPPDRHAALIPIEEFHFPTDNDTKDYVRLKRHKRDVSDMSLGETDTFPPTLDTLPVPETSERPTSIATIRGVSSLPTLSKDPSGPFTMDHYATLLALVHTERSAREALESQVKRLGYQVSVLAKTSAMRRDTRYDPPPTAKSFGDKSAFDHDDDENEAEITMVVDNHARSIDPEDSGIGTGHGDESEYSEIYETPREEGHTYGAFGEDLEEEDQQKKSARTLSLSQLTRKPPPAPLPHAI